MTREQALSILKEYTQNESLLKHAYAVEAAMRAYAQKFGEDEELWGVVGLLHDFDYEKYPDEHPMKGSEILKEKG
ncbi:MAG TPA: HDIG domain-containing protein, partial [Caldithrix abyssi]|nr:HDIG domain-containing protein [Caldithrix abyssi]